MSRDSSRIQGIERKYRPATRPLKLLFVGIGRRRQKSVGSRMQKEGELRWGGVVLARGLRQSCLPRHIHIFPFPLHLSRHSSTIRHDALPSSQERVRYLFCLLILFLDVVGYFYHLLLPAYHGLHISTIATESRGYHSNDPNMLCRRLCKQLYIGPNPCSDRRT